MRGYARILELYGGSLYREVQVKVDRFPQDTRRTLKQGRAQDGGSVSYLRTLMEQFYLR